MSLSAANQVQGRSGDNFSIDTGKSAFPVIPSDTVNWWRKATGWVPGGDLINRRRSKEKLIVTKPAKQLEQNRILLDKNVNTEGG
jgi:hypothetical protein